MTMTMMIIW